MRLPHKGPRNRRRDRWIIRHVPISVVEYPLESVLAVWGMITGSQVIFGVSTPSIADLPWPLPLTWSLLMLAAGMYIIHGLRKRAYASLVASGISMFGWILLAYAVAIAAFAQDLRKSLTIILLLGAVAVFTFVRAWFLRARDDLLVETFNHGSSNGVHGSSHHGEEDGEEPRHE